MNEEGLVSDMKNFAGEMTKSVSGTDAIVTPTIATIASSTKLVAAYLNNMNNTNACSHMASDQQNRDPIGSLVGRLSHADMTGLVVDGMIRDGSGTRHTGYVGWPHEIHRAYT